MTLHSRFSGSCISTLGYILAPLWARRQWRFPTLNSLPGCIVAYISIYDSFQLYHYVLSKLKWGVHKRVPTNEKILFMWYQSYKTISFRLQFNLFYILKQNFSEDIWRKPELLRYHIVGFLQQLIWSFKSFGIFFLIHKVTVIFRMPLNPDSVFWVKLFLILSCPFLKNEVYIFQVINTVNIFLFRIKVF